MTYIALAAVLVGAALLIIRLIHPSGENDDSTHGGGLDGISEGVDSLDNP